MNNMLRSSGLIHSICSYLFTSVLGQPFSPTFKDCLTLEDETDMAHQHMPRHNLEGERPDLKTVLVTFL